MLVTRFQYPIETTLLPKLDLMIKRCGQKNPKRDAVLIMEGAEGEGKTTFSIAIAYYVAEQLNRVFNHNRVFADLEKMIKFLKNTEEEIAIWDEPALHALSGDVSTTIVKDLTRLLMMARKKRHFLIINLAYFNKFNDYIVWQRPLGMIHVYSRNEITSGRFVYIKKKNLERLWQDWRRSRKRNYKKWCSKRIRGSFPDVLNPEYKNNVLSEFNIEAYEKSKDEAIAKIGTGKTKKALKTEMQLLELRYRLANISGIKQEDLGKHLGVSSRTIKTWKRLLKDNKKLAKYLENSDIPRSEGEEGED